MQYKVDINTLQIPHDQHRNYNNIYDNDYLPPYHHHEFNSIYEGISIEIQIVNHCNLNCANCNHFSPIAKPWNIDIEDFKQQLLLTKNNIPNIKTLSLVGGEPTLHPQFMELCKIAREIFPLPIKIDVLSNGVNLKNLNLQELNLNNIDIIFSSYPTYSQTKEINQFIANSNNSRYLRTRAYMSQVLIDDNGTGNYVNNFYNCSHYHIPCLTIKDSKLYVCPFAAHVEHYFNKKSLPTPICEQDYLNIADIKGNIDKIQDFIFTAKPICSYCVPKTPDVIWHKSFKDIKEYNTTLFDLYEEDYDRYESIISQEKDYFFNCINENLNTADLDVNNCHKLEQDFAKYQGKIDIIIPYYNLSGDGVIQLFNNLKSQSIILDCAVYLIGDNTKDKQVINAAKECTEFSLTLLKNKVRLGPGGARNKGIKHSYNKYIFFLDSDDTFCDMNALKKMYDIMENGNYDYCITRNPSDINNTANFGIIIKREFLEKYNLNYPEFFIAEDNVLFTELSFYSSNYYFIEEPLITYHVKDNTTSITQIADAENPAAADFCHFISYLKIIENNQNILEDNPKLLTQFTKIIYNDYKNMRWYSGKKVNYYYLFYKLYQINPSLMTNNMDIDLDIILNFINNNLQVTIDNSILEGIDEIKNYIITQCNLYNKYFFCKPSIEFLLQFLKEDKIV